MIWMLGVIVTFVGLGALVAVGMAIVAILIELIVRLALAAALSVATGVSVGIAGEFAGWDGMVTGVLAAFLVFVPALMLVARWRSPASPISHPTPARVEVPSPHAISDPYERAWAVASALAPSGAMVGSREACGRILVRVDRQGSIDADIIHYATTLRRHVPALVGETEELLETADATERRVAIADLVDDLRRLGEGAADLLGQQGLSVREKLAVRRARLFGAGRAV